MILGFLALNRWKNNTQNKYISSDLLKVLSPDISTFKPKAKLFLFSFIIFLTISLVNPKIGTELKTVKREGVDLVLPLMFQRVCLLKTLRQIGRKRKRIVSAFINSLNNDRVGIIAYAASALPILPTDDYSTQKPFKIKYRYAFFSRNCNY